MTRHVYLFGAGKADGSASMKELLGGKGAGLAEMTRMGIPVPPGFTITTEVALQYLAHAALPADVQKEAEAALAEVEAMLGATLGDPQKPLLLSVRSGARASMPGMMDTILNLGMNDEVAAGMAKQTGDERFAYDAFRRFIMMFADVVMHVPRAVFEKELTRVRREVAKTKGLDPSRFNDEELKKRVPDGDFAGSDMKALVPLFKSIYEKETGKAFPSDARSQLWGAVGAVFESWNNHRAKIYRKMHGIPDSWGTACTVQAMVFGNLGDDSGTGVAFTRDPSTGEKRFYGEWLPNAQGEDVVAGIRTPQPLLKDSQGGDQSLEVRMPQAYAELAKVREQLEKHFRDMQDLEFTIQRGKLFLLQCRTGKRTGKAAVRVAVEMAREGLIDQKEAILRVEPQALDQLLHPTLDPSQPKTLLARGLPASPGAASGHVVFSADEAERRAGQGKPVILVRVETSPEDIHGMKAARGILTARGGMTSHAAVVARGWGKCCVAGCSAISVNYEQQVMTVTLHDEAGHAKDQVTVKSGDLITLDGSTGSVYLGPVATVPAQLTGDFSELMVWADQVRTMKVRANADTPLDARSARNYGAEGIGLCRTEHMFFDDERIAAMREMILASDTPAREKALAKLLPFQKEDFVGIFKEMRGLPVTIRLLDPPLHEFLPHDPGQLEHLSMLMGVSVKELEKKNADLHEFNPMLGHRGCRLAITFPEIYGMQARAILEAAVQVAREGVEVFPEIMIPLAFSKTELERIRETVDKVASDVFEKAGRKVEWKYGTMIELPRAALLADKLAEAAEFFSFGTNDLTQTTLGLSRDDAGKFLPAYVDSGILPADPFQSLDVEGVGMLIAQACEKGRRVRPGIKLGVCGEHGGDPASIRYFQTLDLAYVSCSPFRVPIARLAAAQAALSKKGADSGTA